MQQISINPIAFESLTNTKCLVETFDRNFQFHVAHVSLTDKADAMLIAPASANIIGKIANGIADDMLSTTVMACNKPVIISPAMNTKMYNNPILQDNLDKLRRFGYEIVEPAMDIWHVEQVVQERCLQKKCWLHILRE